MNTQWLLYGSNGYTGELIAREAKRRGMTPILAGRRREAVTRLAGELGLSYRVFALGDGAEVRVNLREVGMVVHCAGPFSKTASPMVEACIANGTHYLDITGEIEVYEMLARTVERARAAGVMVMPGVGFDIVPTDSLAVYLKEKLPTATHLEMAWRGVKQASRGTTLTMLEGVGEGGMVRREGKLTRVPPLYKKRMVDFGSGAMEVVSIPWGDVAMAYYSTGIPNITEYAELAEMFLSLLKVSRVLGKGLDTRPAQAMIRMFVGRMPAGPSADERARGRTQLWGEVRDGNGNVCAARMKVPEAYQCTVLTAIAAVERVLRGEVKPGFQSATMAWGTEFVMEVEGVTRTDVVL